LARAILNWRNVQVEQNVRMFAGVTRFHSGKQSHHKPVEVRAGKLQRVAYQAL
jgi:hypothetical protein